MTVELFDVQTGCGGQKTGERKPVPAEELIEELERLSIGGALLRTVPDDLDRDVPRANALLYDTCAAHDGLVPCPLVVPATGGDFAPEEEQVAECIRRGAGAAWVRAAKDHWLLADWSSGRLFRALEARRLPAFCLERDIGFEPLAELAGKYPGLPFILAGVAYRSQRTLVALLETFPNIHFSIGNNFTTNGALKHLVGRAGAARLLFGTGFPDSEAMMAVTLLVYADVSDADKAAIGAANFRRLTEGIQR